MNKLEAKGKYKGSEITIEVEKKDDKLHFLFDGKENNLLKRILKDLLSKRFPVGGSYCPPENSLLNAWNVLSYRFFDDPRKVIMKIHGEIEEIPYDGDKIY